MEVAESLADSGVETVDMEAASIAAAPPRRTSSKAPAPAKRRIQDVEDETQLREGVSLRDWIDELLPEGDIKVTIFRKAPRVGPGGEHVYGTLETVSERIDEDYIRQTWGGGTFGLTIQIPRSDQSGRYRIFRRVQMIIAGPPKMHGRDLGSADAANGDGGNSSLAARAFESMERREKEAQERLHRVDRDDRRHQGMDTDAITAFTGPIMAQLSDAQRTIRELQVKLVDQANRPTPPDAFRDQLMSRMMDSEKTAIDTMRVQYEGRIEAQRERYEGRIDRLTEAHEAAIKRLEDRHTDDTRRLEQRHEREIRAAEKQSEGTTKNTSIAYDARMDAQKETIGRLERELAASTTKIATLEAKKDQSISEKADELLSVQEALAGLGGGEKAEEKWWSKALDIVGNSEAAMAVINRFTGGSPEEQAKAAEAQAQFAAAQQQQLQLPPPGVPFQTGDGNVYVRDEAGVVSVVDQSAVRQQMARVKKKKKAAAAAQGAGEIEEGGDGDDDEVIEASQTPTGRPPDPKDVALAISFMENAVASNADPESFARSAQSLIPADILAWIGQVGVDSFLNKSIKPGSTLGTVRGRNFARAVAKLLLGAPA